MTPYAAIFRARYLVLLQYRAAAVAGLGTQLAFGFIRVMILQGFYASGQPSPMPLDQAISYVWLGQAFLMLLPWSTDSELRDMVRTGNVAYELARPVDLYGVWFWRGVALRVAPTTLRALPLIVIAGAFLGLRPPASVAAGVEFLAAMIAAVLLAAALTTLSTIMQMWTVAGEGASRLLPSLSYFFAGMAVPLPLFPPWAQRIFAVLPFRGLIDAPFRLYVGNIGPAEAVWVIGHQVVWIAALIGLGRYLMARGLQRLNVEGG